GSDNDQRIALGKVPRVSGEPSRQPGEEVLRPIYVKHGIARQEETKQVIEAHEVVHVRVRDEDVRDLQDVARLHATEATEIELQRATLPAEPNEESGIAEGAVDQA